MCGGRNIAMLLLLLLASLIDHCQGKMSKRLHENSPQEFPGVHMSLRRFSFLLALAVLLASPAWAQFNSNLPGAGQDSSGAVVPKATVTLVNVGTQVTRTTTADADGNYRFVSLSPGAYKLTVEASGYSRSE